MAERTRIFLADHERLFREGLRRILESHRNYEIVGESSRGPEVVELVKKTKPDVVLLELGLPEWNGIVVTRHIARAHGGAKVLVLTRQRGEDAILQVFRAGAVGFVPKEAGSQELVRAIEVVRAGGVYRDRLTMSVEPSAGEVEAGKGWQAKPKSRFNLLTNREREVLTLLASGQRNADVAKTLGISVKTVEIHRAHLMDKLNLHRLADLVRYSIQKGLVPHPSDLDWHESSSTRE